MGRNAIPEADKLKTVGGAVPHQVYDVVQRIAHTEGRTVSQVVRNLIEESPRVVRALKGVKSK